MPHTEKLKLKEESRGVETAAETPVKADHRILVQQIHEAYVRNFNMNKAKARLILTGKTNKPVRLLTSYGSMSSPPLTSPPPPAAFRHPRHGDVPARREDVGGPHGDL